METTAGEHPNPDEWRRSRPGRELRQGNPFHPTALNPDWLTPTVTALAQAAYDDRILPKCVLDPQRLSVLADALLDAGCTDTDLLSHLRCPGPHFRGCFTLDMLLGRT